MSRFIDEFSEFTAFQTVSNSLKILPLKCIAHPSVFELTANKLPGSLESGEIPSKRVREFAPQIAHVSITPLESSPRYHVILLMDSS